MPVQCDSCWTMRREGFNLSPLYRAFLSAAGVESEGQKRFDAYQNWLLSWSYILLERVMPDVQPECPESTTAVTEPQGGDIVGLRHVGIYRDRQPVTPGAEDERGALSEKHLYLKACPARFPAVTGLAVRLTAGFEIPPLRHGEPFDVTACDVERVGPERYVLVPRKNGTTRVHPGEAAGASRGFLQPYAGTDRDQQVRRAVDEMAFRLFGFRDMQPFQHRILERVLCGESTLAIAATGSGKSECFILPAMLLPGVTIAISPLKSLMTDQYQRRIRDRFGLDHLSTFINGDVPLEERQRRLRRLELGYYKLVYFTPEQLERGWILESLRAAHEAVGIRYLAMDEAHCISQWGHDFRPAYLNLCRRLAKVGIDPVRIALTATASPLVRVDVCDELGLNSAPVEAGGDVFVETSNRPELNFIVIRTQSTAEKVAHIEQDLREFLAEDSGAAIVFMPWTGGNPDLAQDADPPSESISNENETTEQREVDDGPSGDGLSPGVTLFGAYLESRLNTQEADDGAEPFGPIAIYHSKMEADDPDRDAEDPAWKPGKMSGRSRRTEQRAFSNGERRVMVATKGFGMGIDKRDVHLVIHRTPPSNLEAYAQEAGRAGRDSQLSNVILYYSLDAPARVLDEDDVTASPDLPFWDELLEEPPATDRRSEDFRIQERFLRDKYIRRDDVEVMRALSQER